MTSEPARSDIVQAGIRLCGSTSVRFAIPCQKHPFGTGSGRASNWRKSLRT